MRPAGAGSASAQVHETHVGIVLLVGDRAYKVKKPVRTSFCDFSTSALRRVAIERELRLNRRLAPDVYLGTARLDGAGCAEPVLVMRRMPDDRRLSRLVSDGCDVTDHLRRLARMLAALHARSERSASITADASADALLERWRANLAGMEALRGNALDPGLLDGAGRLAARFLAGRRPLFVRRAAEGRVVDGHGDLLADDVFCLDDGPRALDCLDFDDSLRHVDGLDDAAFLAMDLERLGADAAARYFLHAYAGFAADPAPDTLVHHYVAYRAGVRATVAAVRHLQQPDVGADADAARLLTLTMAHLRAGAPRLVLVGGLPGTGKSTLAAGLADRTGAVLVSSDRVRKELAGMAPSTSAAAPFGSGLYAPEHTGATYRELLTRAAALLSLGESVVLDASWTCARRRTEAAAVADDRAAELVQVRCVAPSDVAAARIRARHGSASDATPAVAAQMAATVDAWPDALEVDTTAPAARCVDMAREAWDAATDGLPR
ncbi:gluconate kinase [Pseudonocardia dioxanivorans CB1190]|uniref:Gluconate kinase n=1 Tax=Pseudonocardia dioxanivorans (strain ATCC 55486 / DSM 44775 / JCM 13855 / CB1190) TaxID=675635 RepID=F4CJW6_PSEUX|nr:AAA family ATPase [Pseudonocardia dioxanivorans]AEA26991.1 gluconate kinase [Pseudonocardia dioxanivorans CB1190]